MSDIVFTIPAVSAIQRVLFGGGSDINIDVKSKA